MAKKLTGLTNNIQGDYNILDVDSMDELLFSGYDRALGAETRERILLQIANYEYYDGKQHKDESGNLVRWDELTQPPELDYMPTRFPTNYFRSFISKKARWQMSGKHSIHVPRKQIDDPLDKLEEGYEPSAEQQKENERADQLEELLNQLWRENKMRARLLQAARDRLIADRVVCKIIYDPIQGRMRWIWRPDYEFIPVYSDDDFEDLIGAYFITHRKVEEDGEDVDAIKLQAYRMHEGEAYLHEAIYKTQDLSLFEELVPSKDVEQEVSAGSVKLDDGKKYMPMGLEFIPVVQVPVDDLLGGIVGDSEIEDLRVLNDILNKLNEDSVDAMLFEMFPITAVLNTSPGVADKMELAPGAIVEARGDRDGVIPEIRKVESGFRWREAHKETFNRIKSSMHEISSLPQVVPQEMNFGGMNAEALRLLFQDIIADTEEHWLSWGYALAELHEKTIKYMKARTSDSAFIYDKDVVRGIEEYETTVNFQLPLPDNRRDLVDLLIAEVASELESKKGAMERLGVDNVQAKMKEIQNEKLEDLLAMNPYGSGMFEDGEGNDDTLTTAGGMTRKSEYGEEEVLCDQCGGSGTIVSNRTGEQIECPKCRGTGWFQPRKR